MKNIKVIILLMILFFISLFNILLILTRVGAFINNIRIFGMSSDFEINGFVVIISGFFNIITFISALMIYRLNLLMQSVYRHITIICIYFSLIGLILLITISLFPSLKFVFYLVL